MESIHAYACYEAEQADVRGRDLRADEEARDE
jgi:hypothetical protein